MGQKRPLSALPHRATSLPKSKKLKIMICYYPVGIYNNNINSVGDTAVEQLVKLDTNGRGCGDLYRRLADGKTLSLGSIYPPAYDAQKFVVLYRGLFSEFDTRQLSMAWVERMEQERDQRGIAPHLFNYIPSEQPGSEAEAIELFNTVGREEVMGRFQSLNDKADDLFDMVVARRPGMSSYFTPICLLNASEQAEYRQLDLAIRLCVNHQAEAAQRIQARLASGHRGLRAGE